MISLKRIYLLIFISLGLLLLAAPFTSLPQSQGALPSSTVSTFPTQIEIECTYTLNIAGSTATCMVGEWSQASGSNSSLPIQISVNEANQTFSLATSNTYKISTLTLLISDPNGTAGISMTNPGTITISSSDKWSYSPIGTETTDLYSGEYFQIQKGTGAGTGLFGFPSNPLPPFPTITYDLLGYHITVPNFLDFFQWVYKLIAWAFNELVLVIAIGWEDVIGIPVKYIGEGITYISNLYDGVWNTVYDAFAALPDGLGIFALPVASLAFGALLLITVAGFALVGEGLVKLVTL